jgi:hypothetical protein
MDKKNWKNPKNIEIEKLTVKELESFVKLANEKFELKDKSFELPFALSPGLKSELGLEMKLTFKELEKLSGKTGSAIQLPQNAAFKAKVSLDPFQETDTAQSLSSSLLANLVYRLNKIFNKTE